MNTEDRWPLPVLFVVELNAVDPAAGHEHSFMTQQPGRTSNVMRILPQEARLGAGEISPVDLPGLLVPRSCAGRHRAKVARPVGRSSLTRLRLA